MINWLKQLFCRHDYVDTGKREGAGYLPGYGGHLFVFDVCKCSKCGKERLE